MRHRYGAFLLTLLVASAPVSRIVCELVCPQPLVELTSSCHDGTADRDAATIRSQSHACGETHVDSLPAIRTADISRAQAEAFTTFLSWSQAQEERAATPALSALAVHGPPGAVPGRAQILATILRI